VRPLNEAADYKISTLRRMSTWFDGLVSQHYTPAEQAAMLTDLRYFPRLGATDDPRASLSPMARLMVALNHGNKDNKQRLRDGFGLTDQAVQDVIDSLDDRDWDFVVAVWQGIDQFWPEIEAKMKRLQGVAAKKVEPVPFTTKNGREIPGGYFPIVFNRKLDTEAGSHQLEDLADLHKHAAGMNLTVKRNHEKARSEADVSGKPLRLDFGVIAEHLEDVVHSLAYHEALVDIGRLLKRRTIRKTILDLYGEPVWTLIQGQLNYVAVGEREQLYAIDRFADRIRRNSQVVGLGGNLVTPLIQLTGLAPIAARAGYGPTRRAIAKLYASSSPIANVRALQRESTFLTHRAVSFTPTMLETTQRAGLRQGAFERGAERVSRTVLRRPYSSFQRGLFIAITQMQMVVDAVAYVAGRDQALARGVDPETARALGEQMVRDTQGSGEPAYVAQVMRGGPYKKLWTTFMGPMVALHNVYVDRIRQARQRRQGGEPIAAAGDMAAAFLTIFVLGPAMMTVLREAAKGDLGDEDDYEKWFWEFVNTFFGRFIGARDAAQALSSGFGYEGPPGTRPVATAVTAGRRVAGAYNRGESVGLDAALGALQVAGGLYGLPTGAVLRAINGWIAYQDGETTNPLAPIFGYDRDGYEEAAP
jgi:hypothetical protein